MQQFLLTSQVEAIKMFKLQLSTSDYRSNANSS